MCLRLAKKKQQIIPQCSLYTKSRLQKIKAHLRLLVVKWKGLSIHSSYLINQPAFAHRWHCGTKLPEAEDSRTAKRARNVASCNRDKPPGHRHFERRAFVCCVFVATGVETSRAKNASYWVSSFLPPNFHGCNKGRRPPWAYEGVEIICTALSSWFPQVAAAMLPKPAMCLRWAPGLKTNAIGL